MTAERDTWATSSFQEPRPPQIFVQWKGTDVCLDFLCKCGASGHLDRDFVYMIKCPTCGQIYTMPHSFGLIEGGEDGPATGIPSRIGNSYDQ